MNRYKINAYCHKNSIIHRLNPIFKILCLIINVIVIIGLDSFFDYLLMFIYLFLIIIFSKIDIRLYLKNIYTMRVFIIFIIVINIIFNYDIIDSVEIILKVIYLVLCSSIITYTTDLISITYGLEKILKVFNFIIPSKYIALSISLSIRFIPLITIEADRITNSISLRGVEYSSIKGKLNTISYMFIPLIYSSLKRSDVIAEIMDVRLYNIYSFRTNYKLDKLKIKDYILLILNIVLLVFILEVI